jgi:hypothetical protein
LLQLDAIFAHRESYDSPHAESPHRDAKPSVRRRKMTGWDKP